VTPAVEATGLQLRYGEVTALDDLSLSLPGGRIYGLLGRNGSGKTSLLSVLTLGFALEGVLYRALDWQRGVAPERLFDAAGPYPLVFLSYWAMLLIWTTIGVLLAAGFYRSGGSELVVILLALAMVAVTGYGIGFDGLPFVGGVVDVADVPLAATVGLCLAGLLPGAAVIWALVRDIPIRNRTA
jgi:hypothetical protein